MVSGRIDYLRYDNAFCVKPRLFEFFRENNSELGTFRISKYDCNSGWKGNAYSSSLFSSKSFSFISLVLLSHFVGRHFSHYSRH